MQSIVISVVISVVLSALFTIFMNVKSAKALGREVSKQIAQIPKNLK